ncbi:28S ribosomal protein S28, mitochondrial-like [Daphnia pulex]|uniref:28S ribosomal protein S28, mitochondrial-like n=1 Tax=Daphnia pulex TaxID=6669 RepID=UPI001EDF9AE1|nr:28S ribosomal protein S28, mitochondrial-like [Daphnia pulex]XP_046459278.1 28S ribosomal protein S28, mitochondrial-like [Daphnia pulex]
MDKIVRRTLLSAGRPSMNCFRNFADVVPQSNNLVNTDRSDLNEQEMSHKESNNKSLSGFGKAFTKFSKLTNKSSLDEPDVFATLLRHSKLIQLGDPQGKIVEGKIFQVVGNDLYIDFGGKFHCVCSKPNTNESEYVRGSRVRLRLQELELSTKFLGASQELTLREADALLLGLARTSGRKAI